MVDSSRGARQAAYQVLVADDPEKLVRNEGNLWDSGRVESDNSIQIVYEGKPLLSRMRVWWKVRVWDAAGTASPWSEPARWTMGLLAASDWQAKWIGYATPPPPIESANNGYHSQMSSTPDSPKWVTIDLEETREIDTVVLYPARPYNWHEDSPGFLFPLRFRIEVAEQANFSDARVVVDRTEADVDSPGDEPLVYKFPTVGGRYVRLTATRLRERNSGEYGLALAEVQVLAGGEEVGLNKPVAASDSIEQHEWSTAKLVDGDRTSHGRRGFDALTPPLLRKSFGLNCASGLKHATAYVTALGLYELRINGERIGDHVLAPEWTDYHKRIQYQTYDVTSMVTAGENALGVMLGDGWYAGRIGLTGIVPGGLPRAIYGRQPRLLLQLELEYDDGSMEHIVSDDTWKCTTEGPLRSADLLDGETYDARRELAGWDKPVFDDEKWNAAGVFEPTDAALVSQPNEPIRITREIKPIAVKQSKPQQYIFDLGQNMVGWCRLQVRGAAGDEIRLRHAEVLNPDGSIYTTNLRSAAQTDRYILSGNGEESFEPHFTYHGFRYVEASGLSTPPTLESLTGCVLHSAPREVGRFECSNPLLNKLWENIFWTQRANMHSIPTDCPQRDERLGWMGDILAFAQTACFNMDMAAFYTKWIPDVRDAQTDDGRYPDFAPHPFDPAARFSGVAAWGDAGVFVPWCAYQNYGDRRMIEQHYGSARRWVDWIRANNPDLLWKNKRHNDYGDWLNADTLKLEGWPETGAAMPKEAFATAFFARSTEIVSQMASVLGLESDAKKYGRLAAEIRAAFNRAYVAKDGRIQGDTQAGYAIALHFGLLPEKLRPVAAEYMVDCFKKYDGQISTGFHSTICLMRELTRYGYTDEAYRLINNREMPSWGYAIDHGATTIWERWDGYVEGRGFQNPGMNSFSHYAIGSVGEWMYRTIVGINPDPKVPAYKRFIIHPQPGGGLSWARGSYDSMYGRIECEWRIVDSRISVTVVVPANTSATVYLPTDDASSITESSAALNEVEGVNLLATKDAATVLQVGAGRYVFEADWRE